MEPNLPENTTEQSKVIETGQNPVSSKKRVVIVSILLIIFVGITLFWFVYQNNKVVSFIDLKGDIYLTLALKGDNAANLYTLDVSKRVISRLSDDDFVKYTSKISPDGDKIAYMAAPIDRKIEKNFPYSGFLQVYVKSFNEKDAKQLTDSPTSAKRLPTWSPDGKKIAFTAQYPGSPQEYFFKPNGWGVGVVDLEGNTTRIDFGTSPFWYPDGSKLLFLRNDGLYFYDFSENKSTKILVDISGRTASTNMKLDISKDGSMLAWSDADSRELTLFEITSWAPFQLVLKQKIDIENNMLFWPIFSPDNKYLVFQEVKVNSENGELTNPTLIVYDIRTSEQMELASLDEYNFDIAFITDWR